MRVAIMQPYLFPYVGYFQLLHCADVFVLLDDVAYIKKGWVNRNQVLVKGVAHLFTIPLAGSSQNKLLKDIQLHPDGRARQKLLATIRQEYHAAPEFATIFSLVEQVLLGREHDLTAVVLASLQLINAHVGLAIPILRSSALPKDNQVLGQARILAICQCLGAHEYVNMVGGRALYSAAEFSRQGIELRFLQPTLTPYRQNSEAFVPGLSVIDLLMQSTPLRAREFFQQRVLL